MITAGCEARKDDRDNTLRDFMKGVREEKEKLWRMVKMLPQAQRSAAGENPGETRQTAQRGSGERELEERSLEAETGRRSVESQLGGRGSGERPVRSGLGGDPLRDRHGLGASDRRSELGAGANIGQGLGSMIRERGRMGGRGNIVRVHNPLWFRGPSDTK